MLGECLVAMESDETLFAFHSSFVLLVGGNVCGGMCMLLFCLYDCHVCTY